MKFQLMHIRFIFIVILLYQHTIGAHATNNIVINEIQVANIDMFIDPSFNYGAWIELFNPSETAVSLAGMRLRHTDSDDKVDTYMLNASHGTIAPHGFATLWFDHNSRDGSYGSGASRQI